MAWHRWVGSRIGLSLVIIGVALLLGWVRQLLLPTFFELQGVPSAIAAPSALNACYANPGFVNCGDAVIIGVAILAVTIVSGRGHPAAAVFAVILALMPTFFYFVMFSSLLPVLLGLFAVPVLVQLLISALFPEAAAPRYESAE